MTDLVCAPLLRPAGLRWWIAFLVCTAGTDRDALRRLHALSHAASASGASTPASCGASPIANYVWWIGIGNAGTLISSLLVLTRQSWRASISRFAEAMTLFAVSIAGLFPIFHLGRPLYFYWLAPYPATMQVWPQWRSALIWDFWAITSYLIFSIIFWYVGVLPDLATVRDRSSRRMAKDLRRLRARLARLGAALAPLPTSFRSRSRLSRRRWSARCIPSSASISPRA